MCVLMCQYVKTCIKQFHRNMRAACGFFETFDKQTMGFVLLNQSINDIIFHLPFEIAGGMITSLLFRTRSSPSCVFLRKPVSVVWDLSRHSLVTRHTSLRHYVITSLLHYVILQFRRKRKDDVIHWLHMTLSLNPTGRKNKSHLQRRALLPIQMMY